ncbi:MAG: hypothetical protein HQ564_08175 [Candidatus Saganbacteria bacterium]|nr:hypothetical protein [Candidatus Saganbacteria bacterium]
MCDIKRLTFTTASAKRMLGHLNNLAKIDPKKGDIDGDGKTQEDVIGPEDVHTLKVGKVYPSGIRRYMRPSQKQQIYKPKALEVFKQIKRENRAAYSILSDQKYGPISLVDPKLHLRNHQELRRTLQAVLTSERSFNKAFIHIKKTHAGRAHHHSFKRCGNESGITVYSGGQRVCIKVTYK